MDSYSKFIMTQPLRYKTFFAQRSGGVENITKQTALLTEYASLRSEILTRHGLRNQILIFTIVGLGIVLTLCLTDPALYSSALFYPIITTFLAIGWSQHDVRIGEIGSFIAHNIEPLVDGLNWERHLHKARVISPARTLRKPFVRTSELYALGIFVGSQVLVLALALSLPTVEWSRYICSLLVLDITSIIITMIVITKRASLLLIDKNNG